MKKILVFLLLIALAVPAVAAPSDPEAFADWFVAQGFEGREYYQWAAILDALTDGIDRSREAHQEIKTPVFVAILTGTVYHNQDCTALKNSSRILELDLLEAQERGFEACKKCM